jgi:hypothetical protein
MAPDDPPDTPPDGETAVRTSEPDQADATVDSADPAAATDSESEPDDTDDDTDDDEADEADEVDDEAAAVGGDDPEAVVQGTAPDIEPEQQPAPDVEPADEAEEVPAPEVDPDDEAEPEYRPASGSVGEPASDQAPRAEAENTGFAEPYGYDGEDDIWSSENADEVDGVGVAAGAAGVDTLPRDTQWRAAHRKQRRQTWTFLGILALVLGTGAVGYGVWSGVVHWPGGTQAAASVCPAPVRTAAPIESVEVNVLNGTERRGLAQNVARLLQARGFQVHRIANDEGHKPGRQAASVRYGAAGELMARTVAAQINGKVVLQKDSREDETVDLALQTGYKSLRPAAAANKLIAPKPVASPQGCLPPTTAP